MKRFLFALTAIFVFTAASCSMLGNEAESPTGTMITSTAQKNVITNGIRTVDVDGNTIFGSGGCMLQVGKYFYWYGEHRYGNGNAIGVSCYRSTDLVNWEWRCDIVDESIDPELNPVFIERPKVIYNAKTNKYVMWAHREGIGWNYGMAEFIVAVGDAPDEPFEFVKSGRPFDDPKFNVHDNGYTADYSEDTSNYENMPYGFMSRDCTLFVDDDGTAYFASSYRENTQMHIYRLTEDYLDIDTTYWPTDDVLHVNQREAPCLFKKDGVYYMVCSGTDGWNITPSNYQYAYDIQGPWSGVYDFGDTDGSGNSGKLDHADRSQPAYVFELKATDGSGNSTFMYMGDKWGPAFGGSSTYDSQFVWSVIEFNSPTDLYTAYSEALVPDVEKGTIGYPQYYYIQNKYGHYLTQATNVQAGQVASWSSTVTTTDNSSTKYRDPYLYQWRFVPTATGYQIVNRWSGLAITASSDESLTAMTLNGRSDENKYQIWKLNSLQSPYYSIQNVNNNYYLSTIVFTTHQTFEQVNGVNALWLTSWGYRVGWTSSTLGEANKRANDIIPRQSWRFIPVSTSDNMSMVN